MTEQVQKQAALREEILSDPDVILEDQDVMRALIGANERALGSNIVDLRGIAMERLERRLDRLEDTHRSVISAAYDNLAGTNLINNAILRLFEPKDFPEFLNMLSLDLPRILNVVRMRLILESREDDAGLGMSDALFTVEPGVVDYYITAGQNHTPRSVTLRQVSPASSEVYGPSAGSIQSEALLKLDLGDGRLPALLAIGSADPKQFRPSQGVDLLTFFGSAFERAVRRWLA